MKYVFFFVALCSCPFRAPAFGEHKTLAIGATAPDFALPGVDGKTYSLASFQSARVLVIIFSCNHCPTAQAYEDRIMRLTADYAPKGVAVVVISPNDPKSIRLDELDFSDLSDSFDEMKIRAADKHFNFPYLYDGDEQAAANAYGPVATPHVFVFDATRTLRYTGRVDDRESPSGNAAHRDARDAIDAVLEGRSVSVETTKVFGCSIKWAEKRSQVDQAREAWAKEPVAVAQIDEAGIKDLLKNSTDKLRLINVWATWCGPCTAEFPAFITINRMYRNRDFEFISISADNPDHADRVLKFLQRQQASSRNYLFNVDDQYKLIEAIDPRWQGALPYTLLVEPGGKIIYAHQGEVDPAELKRTIVADPIIGRYP
jgi:peroxiredoxin